MGNCTWPHPLWMVMKYSEEELSKAIKKALKQSNDDISAFMHEREKRLGRSQEWSIDHSREYGKLTITIKVIAPRSGRNEAIWWTRD